MARRPALSDAGVTRPSLAVISPEHALPASHARRPPARKGKKMVAAFIDEGAWLQLRTVGLRERTSVQTILCQALDDWFRKKRLPPIAGTPS
jgi:hypothetical protein